MNATLVWATVDLANVRTEILRSLDLTRGPAAAAAAVRSELAYRATEGR